MKSNSSRKEFIAEYMPIDSKSTQPRMQAEILAWDLDDARVEAQKAADPGYKLTLS